MAKLNKILESIENLKLTTEVALLENTEVTELVRAQSKLMINENINFIKNELTKGGILEDVQFMLKNAWTQTLMEDIGLPSMDELSGKAHGLFDAAVSKGQDLSYHNVPKYSQADMDAIINAGKSAQADFANTPGGKLNNGINAAQGAYNDVASKAQAAAGDLSGKAQAVYNDVAGKAQGVAGDISGKAQGVYNDVAGKAQAVAGDLSGKAQAVYNDVAGKAQELDYQKTPKYTQADLDALTAKHAQELSNLQNSVGGKLNSGIDQVRNQVTRVLK